jgi:hypothetical protein
MGSWGPYRNLIIQLKKEKEKEKERGFLLH